MRYEGWALLWIRRGNKYKNSVRFYWMNKGPYLELVGVEVVTSDRLMDTLSSHEMPVYTIQFEDHIDALIRFITR